jgi:hypothetical protein
LFLVVAPEFDNDESKVDATCWASYQSIAHDNILTSGLLCPYLFVLLYNYEILFHISVIKSMNIPSNIGTLYLHFDIFNKNQQNHNFEILFC